MESLLSSGQYGPPLDYSFKNISSLQSIPSKHPRYKSSQHTLYITVIFFSNLEKLYAHLSWNSVI